MFTAHPKQYNASCNDLGSRRFSHPNQFGDRHKLLALDLPINRNSNKKK